MKNICCDQGTVCLLNYDNLEHKGNGSLGGSEVVKEFYKDSGNLKWVAWGLKAGTESGWTSINRVSILSSLISFTLLQLILSCTFKEHQLNWLLLLLLYFKSIIYHLKRGLKFVSGKILKLNSPPS